MVCQLISIESGPVWLLSHEWPMYNTCVAPANELVWKHVELLNLLFSVVKIE